MADIDFYWDIVMNASSTTEIFINGGFYYYFVYPFLQKNQKSGLVGFTYVAVMLYLKFCPYEMEGITAYAIGILITFFAMNYLDRENKEKNFFLSITFFLMEWISWGCALLPWDILYEKLILPPEMMNQIWKQFGLYLFLQILSFVLKFFVMAAMVALIHRVYVCKRDKMKREEMFLMLAPSFLAAMGWFVFVYFTKIYEKDTKWNFYHLHSEYKWVLFFYQAVSFLTMFVMVVVYQRIKDAQQKEKEEVVLFHQIEDIKRHIRESENLYQEIRSLKHDMGNHIMILENLYGENEDTKNYMSQLKRQYDKAVVEMKSQNPVTDVILKEKEKEALEQGIAFYHDFHYPQSGNVNVFDISVILNNALSNAIEAAVECENPYIKIFSYCKKNAFLIEVKNSAAAKRLVDETSGLIQTTKEGEGHGYGLANIRKVAQSYYGDIDIKQEESEFQLCVMLMIF